MSRPVSEDIYHITQNEDYARQAEAEAEYWSKPPIWGPDSESAPVVVSYLNRRFTGDPRLAWYETIPSYGDFRRGCVLGLGGGEREAQILERNPSLHLTIYDISKEALAQRERKLIGQYPERVSLHAADLNFVELAPEAFDLIISDSCMHHILNLEHVAFQANRALTSDGYFFLHDYVGESRFQFPEEKRRAFERAFGAVCARRPSLRYWRPAWARVDLWDEYSPFEAIRSQESIEVFRRYLSEISFAGAGQILLLATFLRPVDDPAPGPPLNIAGRLQRFALRRLGRYDEIPTRNILEIASLLGRELIPADRDASEIGDLRPNIGFAVYRKRQL